METTDYGTELARFPELSAELETEAERLRMYAGDVEKLDRDPFLSLFLWGSSEATAFMSKTSQIDDLVLPIVRQDHVPLDAVVGFEDVFPEKLQAALKPGNGFPWWEEGTPGVVLAGSAASGALYPDTCPGDYDFFLIVPSVDEKGRKRGLVQRMKVVADIVEKAIRVLKQTLEGIEEAYVKFTPTCVTWKLLEDNVVVKQTKPLLAVQIVGRLYETPAQVVHGFDVDACRVLFTGENLWLSEGALRVVRDHFMLVNPIRQSPTYQHRLLKYHKRYGFGILSPGHSDEMLCAAESYVVEVLNSRKEYQKTYSVMSGLDGAAKLLALVVLDMAGLQVNTPTDYGSNASCLTDRITFWHYSNPNRAVDETRDMWDLQHHVGYVMWQWKHRDVDMNAIRKGLSKFELLVCDPQRQWFTGSFRPQPTLDWYGGLKRLRYASRLLDVLKFQYVMTNELGEVCSICKDRHKADSEYDLLLCGHAFGRKCLSAWFSDKGHHTRKCPICKALQHVLPS